MIKEFNPKNDPPYHFESSNSFCKPEIVKEVAKNIKNSIPYDKKDSVQLDSIIKLEHLRFSLAMKKIEIEKYKAEVQKIVKYCAKLCDRSPFAPTAIHALFYEQLNREYK